MEQPVAAVLRTKVPPRHCDAQGMLHASRFYEYFEDAFLHWLDTCVGGYGSLREAGVDLVVVASGCEHHQGARLGDPVEIEVRPSAVGRTSLAIAFSVTRPSGERIASGRTTYVAISGAGAPTPLPERLATMRDRI